MRCLHADNQGGATLGGCGGHGRAIQLAADPAEHVVSQKTLLFSDLTTRIRELSRLMRLPIIVPLILQGFVVV